MLIKGYINELRGETPADLRMGVPAPTSKLVGLSVTLIETQRKAPINAPYQSSKDAHMLEDWHVCNDATSTLRINADSYNVVVWDTSQFSRPVKIW
jgi:hypothetical protein